MGGLPGRRAASVRLLALTVTLGVASCDVGFTTVQFACGDGEAPATDGGCVNVGVATCPSGEASVDGACPTHSPAPCQFASPGDAECPDSFCDDVDADGFSTVVEFVDITDDEIVFVDASGINLDQDGTRARPFRRIQDALDAAAVGGDALVVLVAPGVYREALRVDAAIGVVGVCPERTAIDAPAFGACRAAVCIGPEAGGSVLMNLAISGPGGGVRSDATEPEVELSHVHIHHTGGVGVEVRGAGAGQPSRLGLRDSVIEDVTGAGLLAKGANVTVSASAIRRILPGSGDLGRAVSAHVLLKEPKTLEVEPTTLTLTESLIECAPDAGVFDEGATVILERSWVRGDPSRVECAGRGVVAQKGRIAGSESLVRLTDVVVEDVADAGLEIVDSRATVLDTVIQRVAGRWPDGCAGQGVRVRANPSEVASLALDSTLIEGAHTAGVHIDGARDVRLARTWIRGTLEESCSGEFGDGVAVFGGEVVLEESRIDASARTGLASFGADATLSSVVVTGNGDAVSAQPWAGVQPSVTREDDYCGDGEAWSRCGLTMAMRLPWLGRLEGTVALRACVQDTQGTSAVPGVVYSVVGRPEIRAVASDAGGRVALEGLPADERLVVRTAKDGRNPRYWMLRTGASDLELGLFQAQRLESIPEVDIDDLSKAAIFFAQRDLDAAEPGLPAGDCVTDDPVGFKTDAVFDPIGTSNPGFFNVGVYDAPPGFIDVTLGAGDLECDPTVPGSDWQLAWPVEGKPTTYRFIGPVGGTAFGRVYCRALAR